MEKILGPAKEHLNKVLKTVEGMRKTLRLFCSDEKGEEIDNASKKVMEMERQADTAKAEILDELSKGEFHPINRGTVIRLVTTSDDIAENARAAAVKATILDPSRLDEGLKNDLDQQSGLALEIVRLLESAYSALSKNPKEALERTGKVEKMEEKIDSFRTNDLSPRIVEWADQSDMPGTSIVLLEIESNIEEVADQAENAADIIREIAIESI